MSSLTVTVKIAGVSTSGLTVSAYAATNFLRRPQRGDRVPNAAATATGTTAGGSVTLTGLSAADYEILVIDSRGVNNWQLVPASVIGGTTIFQIPWTTPSSVSSAVSTGGDTPGGAATVAPFSLRQHFHQVPAVPVITGTITTPPTVPPAMTYYCCAVAANGNWVLGGSAGLAVSTDQGTSWTQINTGGFIAADVYASGNTILAVGTATAITYAFKASTDGGATWSAAAAVTGPTAGPSTASRGWCIILGTTWWIVAGNLVTKVYQSTNSGASWSAVNLPAPNSTNHSCNATAIATDGLSTIVVIGEDGQTGSGCNWVYSSNAGSSWTAPAGTAIAAASAGIAALPFSTTFAFTSGAVQGSDVIASNTHTAGLVLSNGSYPSVRAPLGQSSAGLWALACVYASTIPYTVAWTLNGGVTWNFPTSSPFTTQCNDIAFVSSTEIIAVGVGGPAAPLVIITI